jgi:light-regulated signal transduction histidine kinase (bacteriophytochrome)
VLASSIDITTRKRLEERLTANNNALRRSNAELEQFAFIASHDLREPLRKVLSFSRLLQSGRYGDFDDKGNEFIGYIMEAAERMEALLDSLLRYSRVTSRAAPFESVDLETVLEAVQSDLQLSLEEHGASMEWSSLPRIEADPAQMRQLFQNLIANSLKYARDDTPPHITISAGYDRPDRCHIQVKDNGIGFDMAYAEQIFEVFKRLHGRDAYAGTGMGLAICRKIVERHNGTIHAESVPGKGTTFHITLPSAQGELP